MERGERREECCPSLRAESPLSPASVLPSHPPTSHMNRLSYVKTDSYVSLVDLEDEEAPVIKPPVFVFGVDSHGAYLRHRAEDLANRGEIFVERRVHSGDRFEDHNSTSHLSLPEQ